MYNGDVRILSGAVTKEKGNFMPIVKHKIDPNKPPKVSSADLATLDAIDDADIDYSDIPELTDSFFNQARKVSVTAQFDADVVEWFKAQGKGYQTRMNAVLRAFYERHRT